MDAGTGTTFYLSHAHTPRLPGEAQGPDELVLEFFHELDDRVREVAGLAPGTPAGFFSLALGPGQSSPERIRRELATCRVLVPLFAPRYFASPICGREMSAFLRRTRGETAPEDTPIAPVLWAPPPSSWPPVPAPPVRPEDPALDDRYTAAGLYELMAMRAYDRDCLRDYRTIVDILSTRIVRLAESSPIAPDWSLLRDDVPPAFGEPTTRPRLNIYVLAPSTSRLPKDRSPEEYGESSTDWNPYRSDAPEGLARHITNLADNLGYAPVVTAFDDARDEVLGTNPTGPAVLVVDPWAMEITEWREQLEVFDQRRRPWIGVLLAWDLRDPQTEVAHLHLLSQAERTLQHRFARRRITLRVDAGVASSLGDFGRALSAVIQESAIQYLRQSQHRSSGEIR